MNSNTLGEYEFNTCNGAFKSVDVYENFVCKMTRDEDEGYKISESEARENSWYYDDDKNFHPSWIETKWDSNYANYEESSEEMEKEFAYAKAKKHLKIIVPVVQGTANEYYMPRVKKIAEDCKIWRIGRNKGTSKRINRIEKMVLSRFNKLTHSQLNYSNMGRRIDGLISFGIKMKLPTERIVNNVVWFLIEDGYNDLLQDMHTNNFGLYRGNIAAFDLGQTSYGYRSSTPRTRNSRKKRLDNIKWTGAYRRLEEDYQSRSRG